MLLETLADQISTSNLENKKHFENAIFLEKQTNVLVLKVSKNDVLWGFKKFNTLLLGGGGAGYIRMTQIDI